MSQLTLWLKFLVLCKSNEYRTFCNVFNIIIVRFFLFDIFALLMSNAYLNKPDQWSTFYFNIYSLTENL